MEVHSSLSKHIWLSLFVYSEDAGRDMDMPQSRIFAFAPAL